MNKLLLVAILCLPSALFAQWSVDTKLSTTDTSAKLNENMGRCLAVSGDSVHVVWWDNKMGSGAIYYRHSYDAGVTWSTPVQIAGASNLADFPSISVSGNTVHIAYRDDSTSWYSRSLDGGTTWMPRVSLGKYYWWPSITCDGGMVFVALNSQDPGNSEVWCRRSIDNGSTWDTVHRISNALGRSEDPAIAASGGYVYLVWNDNRDSLNGAPIMQAYGRRSSDNGVTWGPETLWNKPPMSSYFPVVHASGPIVDFAWGDRRGNFFGAFYKHSTDFGASWNSEQQLSSNGNGVAYPVLAREGSDVHIVWWYFGGDVVYRHSTDGGTTWLPEVSLVSVTNNPGAPFIEVSGQTQHVIWLDHRDGHAGVYYKKHAASEVQASDTIVVELRRCMEIDTSITITDSGMSPIWILDSSRQNPMRLEPHTAWTYPMTFHGGKPGRDTSVLFYIVQGSDTVPTVLIKIVLDSSQRAAVRDSVLNFGSVDSGKSVRVGFPITNFGCDILTIDSLVLSGSTGFSVDSVMLPIAIPPSRIVYGYITFHPVAAGAALDTLTVVVSDGTHYRVRLTGVGLGAVASVRTKDPEVSLLEVTPNPASKNAMLRIALPQRLEEVKISFYDAAARLVQTQVIGSLAEGVQNIPLSLLPAAGVSFLRVTAGGRTIGTAALAITP